MRELRIPEEQLVVRAKRQASRDHIDPPRYNGSVTITPMPVDQCNIVKIEFFDRIYSGTPNDIGTIFVEYAREGWQAIYGFTASGELTLYAD